MLDEQVVRLVKALLAGQLSAAVPLLDRLGETGDWRHSHFFRILGSIHTQAEQIGNHLEQRRERWTSEEFAYRRSQRAFAWWCSLSTRVAELFWPEMATGNPFADLVRFEAELDTARQAERLTRAAGGEMEMLHEMEHGGESSSSPGILNRSSGAFTGGYDAWEHD